ncbi:hypothetical protein PIB30_016847 [Stylosanthes scabra]|uniref:Uncharacterized protein n=1 Tax=Stylosanthes scabra TaxID=79078 RepID=A0ABU6T887_9FABA|nr:hypothetical protein [Stylosanthes scabra]
MGKKAKDKGKEREKAGKARVSGNESSHQLPTVVEEEVSVVDNQILGYLEDLKQLFYVEVTMVDENVEIGGRCSECGLNNPRKVAAEKLDAQAPRISAQNHTQASQSQVTSAQCCMPRRPDSASDMPRREQTKPRCPELTPGASFEVQTWET